MAAGGGAHCTTCCWAGQVATAVAARSCLFLWFLHALLCPYLPSHGNKLINWPVPPPAPPPTPPAGLLDLQRAQEWVVTTKLGSSDKRPGTASISMPSCRMYVNELAWALFTFASGFYALLSGAHLGLAVYLIVQGEPVALQGCVRVPASGKAAPHRTLCRAPACQPACLPVCLPANLQEAACMCQALKIRTY